MHDRVMKAENSWQELAGQRWAELQERTDAQLDPLGRAAIELVAPQRGERVLDVGCGAGQSTLELSELVGSTGSVIGLDISEPLLARAGQRVNAGGHANVKLVLGNAATERFEQPFDLIFSRFGVMFFDDPVAAFAHLRQSLRPSGRLGFVCWQPIELNAWAHAPLQAVRALAPERPLPALLEPGKPGPFYFSDPTFVRGVLERAGFVDVRCEAREAVVAISGARTLDEAVDYSLQIGPAARFIVEAEGLSEARVREAIADALRPHLSTQGVLAPARTWLVTARPG
jgi:SAM-dependent methyltransferase